MALPKTFYPPVADLPLRVNYPYVMLIKRLTDFDWHVERKAYRLKEALHWRPRWRSRKESLGFSVRIARQASNGTCKSIYIWCDDHWRLLPR